MSWIKYKYCENQMEYEDNVPFITKIFLLTFFTFLTLESNIPPMSPAACDCVMGHGRFKWSRVDVRPQGVVYVPAGR